MTREELLAALNTLLPAQFEEAVFRLGIPPQYLSQGVPQVTRAIEVLRYLEPEGKLPALEALLRPIPAGAVNPPTASGPLPVSVAGERGVVVGGAIVGGVIITGNNNQVSVVHTSEHPGLTRAGGGDPRDP